MLSKTSVQAVQALVVLSGLPKGAYIGAGAVARKIQAPQNYLGKLLRQLSVGGFVSSQKGLGGGFRLAKNPTKIALLDVAAAVEQVGRWSKCILGQTSCTDQNGCRLHKEWKEVRDHFLQFLRDTKIADVAARPGALSRLG